MSAGRPPRIEYVVKFRVEDLNVMLDVAARFELYGIQHTVPLLENLPCTDFGQAQEVMCDEITRASPEVLLRRIEEARIKQLCSAK